MRTAEHQAPRTLLGPVRMIAYTLVVGLLAVNLPLGVATLEAASKRPEGLFEKAKAAYLRKDYRKAERHFRRLTKDFPGHLFSRMYLGHSLYYQGRYGEAIPEYESAAALNRGTHELTRTEERILLDQLGYSYGITGRLSEARAFFEGAIKADPDYPFYYYNLACTFAEMGKLKEAILNLHLAHERRQNFLPGESFPNPREDESFRPFLGDPDLERALGEMGYER